MNEHQAFLKAICADPADDFAVLGLRRIFASVNYGNVCLNVPVLVLGI